MEKIAETLWVVAWEYALKKLTTRLMTGQKNMVGMTEATTNVVFNSLVELKTSTGHARSKYIKKDFPRFPVPLLTQSKKFSENDIRHERVSRELSDKE